jgi:hypothetical protein
MQEQLDQGLQYCTDCDRFGSQTFCGHCGRRFRGAELEWRECPQCKATVASQFCSLCGEQVWSEYLKQWERGGINLVAEGQRARKILDRMIAQVPRLAEDLRSPAVGGAGLPPPRGTDLVQALNDGFGR